MSGISPIQAYGSYNYQNRFTSLNANRVQDINRNQNVDKNSAVTGNNISSASNAGKIAKPTYEDALSKAMPASKTVTNNAGQSVSAHGDTFSASSYGIKQFQDGVVFAKPASDENEYTSDKYENLTEFSADQLESMYLKGDISIIDYDEEIDKRAEAEILSNEGAVNKASADDEEETDPIKKELAKIKEERTAGADDEQETNPIKKELAKIKEERTAGSDKLDELRKQQESASEKRKALIEEEISSDKTFANKMGKVEGASRENAIRTEGLNGAFENGRMDLIGDVFTKQMNG
ncbi:MAG: hypothetical protein KBS85_06190 [Lachnospiraceae bacterium]|nr:hypothetical protein [Candidatus Merdinaster equi]